MIYAEVRLYSVKMKMFMKFIQTLYNPENPVNWQIAVTSEMYNYLI